MVLLARTVRRVRKARREFPARKVSRAPRVIWVRRVRPVPRARTEQRDKGSISAVRIPDRRRIWHTTW